MLPLLSSRCFEIATQFITLFSTTSSSTTNTTSTNNSQAQLVLSLWLTRRIHTFLHTHLTSHLCHITDAARLRDVWDACTFFATSLGRIGGDFSPLLAQIMEPKVVQMITGHWMEGVQAFQEVLTACREAGVVGPLYHANAATGHVFDEPASSEADTTSGSNTPSPPRQLLLYPPLARLLNEFLVGLNELRRCLFPSIFSTLREFFQKEFCGAITSALDQFERAVLTPGFARQGEDYQRLRDLAQELKAEYDGCLLPYMTSALEVAFGAFENVKALEETVDQASIVEEEVDIGDDERDLNEEIEDDQVEDNNEDVTPEELEEEQKVEDIERVQTDEESLQMNPSLKESQDSIEEDGLDSNVMQS